LVINNLCYSSKANALDKKKIKAPNNEQYIFNLEDLYSLLDGVQVKARYSEQNVSMSIYASYFNELSQSYEPFIEPWTMVVETYQETPKDLNNIKVSSQENLEINMTTGLAENIRSIK